MTETAATARGETFCTDCGNFAQSCWCPTSEQGDFDAAPDYGEAPEGERTRGAGPPPWGQA